MRPLPPYLSCFMDILVLTWNYKGAKSTLFHRHLRDIMRVSKPMILALLEIKVHSNVSLSRIYKILVTLILCVLRLRDS